MPAPRAKCVRSFRRNDQAALSGLIGGNEAGLAQNKKALVVYTGFSKKLLLSIKPQRSLRFNDHFLHRFQIVVCIGTHYSFGGFYFHINIIFERSVRFQVLFLIPLEFFSYCIQVRFGIFFFSPSSAFLPPFFAAAIFASHFFFCSGFGKYAGSLTACLFVEIKSYPGNII